MCLVGSNDSEFDVQGFALALSIPTEEALAALPGFQRRAEAWQFGVSMLESDSATCQFFGAHTLQTKIAADWDTLDAAGQEALRGELIRLAVQHSTGAAHVVSKVNQALVTYAVRMSEAGRWRGVLAAAVEAIAAGAAAAGKSSGSAGRVIVDLVAQFPDEVQRTARGQAQRGAAVQEARDAAAAAVAMLAGVVGAGDGAVADYAAAVGQDAAWRVRAWRGILQWLHFGLAGDAAFERLLGGSLRALERLAARADSDSDEVAAAAAAVEDMVGNTRVAAQYARTVGGLALERLGAGWLGAAVQRCAAARDDEGAMAWASVAVAFGETYTELLLARLGSAPAQQIVQVMLAITAFPGTHGFDEGASDQPLNFWYLLQEAATDAGADAVAAVRPVFAQVVRAVVAKSAYPAAWARGGRDERERFGAFRREAADALLNAYYVLRDDMVDALAADAAHALAQATPDAWRDAEALLFALRSIGEAAGAGGCAALARLLSRDAIERLLQPVVAAGAGAWGLATLQSAVVALLGAYAEWWRAQDDALPAAVACVAAALALPATAAPAAAALRRICDACGEQLRGAAPALVRVACDALAAAVAPREQQRIVEAVAEVAAPALCVAPLAAAAVARLHASIAALEAAAPGAPAAVAASLRVVEALARGLQGDEDADADALRLAARVADSVAEPREALAALMARAVDVRVWPRDAGSGVADVDDAVAEALLGVVGATARRVPHALALDGVAFVAHAWDAAHSHNIHAPAPSPAHDHAHHLPLLPRRRRVKQLSSVRAWCQTYGMVLDSDSDAELASYQSFPDLRRLLEEECAEIERKEAAAKAFIAARISPRRNSDPLLPDALLSASSATLASGSSAATATTSSPAAELAAPSGFMGSLYRLIDPIIPVLGSATSKGPTTGHI
ncbi:hypothetical protein EV174_004139 [Coemansia sp. RSA 2320]|nr:hypothetical protein EV174_004139 [Coemansia sp. RSA 2320]